MTALSAPPFTMPPLLADLPAALEALAEEHGTGDALRPHLLAVLRAALHEGREAVRIRFESGIDATLSGRVCVTANAAVLDRLVSTLFAFVETHLYPAGNPTLAENVAVVAMGGYGRGELAPFSDLDLLFLLPYKRSARVEQLVEYLLYALWDLGLKVGHAVRSVDECIRQAKADITVRTSLLELRYLAGARPLYDELRQRYGREVATGTGTEFVEAKLAERDARHAKAGDSRYVLEPNVKEGKGSLRDLHTLYWIAKYVYQVEDVAELVERGVLSADEAQGFAKAQSFLWAARCHLHYQTGRAEDRLTFEHQRELARRMGYTDHPGALGVERFMKHYFLVAKEVGDLTRIFCAQLEAEQKRKPRLTFLRLPFVRRNMQGFALDGERLNMASPDQFKRNPVDMVRLFRVAQEHELDIHPAALRAITRNLGLIGAKVRSDPEANRLFLEILTSRKDPELALRRMSEAGVLARFVPDFGRVVAQMQYDMYHVYTVDEHTLQAVGVLQRIEAGTLKDELPLATEVIRQVTSRRALYAAMLLHDIAKGRGGDHSVLGAEVAERLCPRLTLSPEETETVAWLVRWHLAMSDAALKRDLEDDKTIEDFAALVQSPERLRLLLVLTTADIRAVGPGRWNSWKAALLAELYHRTFDLLSGRLHVGARDRRVASAQQAMRERLADWSEAELQSIVERGYPAYWLSFDTDTHTRHAALMREADRAQAPLTVEGRHDPDRAVTELTIYAGDHPGLFSRIAGALAAAGANILDAKIFTMTNGMALDIFTVQDAEGRPFDSPDRLRRLRQSITRALTGETRPAQELARRRTAAPNRASALPVRPRVLIDNKASATHTVIEINGRDRPGLLHDVTRTLTGLGLQISTAKISTFGHRAIDVFYVKNVFGLKVDHEQRLNQIRDKLLEALADSADAEVALPGSQRRVRRRVAAKGG